MTDPVLLHKEDAIAVVKLNRPESRNVLSHDGMIEALVGTLEEINADRDVRVAILTGSGTAFSAGGNIKRMLEAAGSSEVAGRRDSYLNGIQRIPRAFARLDVPVIAAVNGPAIGAGLDLSCMCDIRIASESARFAESFIKLGIVPGDGGAWFLPRVVGLPKAIEMSLTGDELGASAALACGLVTKVVPDSALMETATAMANRIARHSGHALRMTKRLLQQSQTLRLEEMLELTAAMQALAHATPEHRDAVERAVAALEKAKTRKATMFPAHSADGRLS